MDPDDLKRRAAFHAVDTYVESGIRLGLGHGSTMAHALERLAEHLRSGRLKDVVGVPVSDHTTEAAGRLGLPLTSLDEMPELDLCIDGADEVDPARNLIKGLGGALLREKIVAVSARRMVVIVDEAKLVDRLGERAPLPVEVLAFGWKTHRPWLEALGCRPEPRRTAGGELFVTDNGNYIYDCRFSEGILEPEALAAALNGRPGVVENGLFLGLADEVVVGAAGGVWVR